MGLWSKLFGSSDQVDSQGDRGATISHQATTDNNGNSWKWVPIAEGKYVLSPDGKHKAGDNAPRIRVLEGNVVREVSPDSVVVGADGEVRSMGYADGFQPHAYPY